MKMNKRVFDLIFIIISASILVSALALGNNTQVAIITFSFIPILIAYFLGQYSQIKFKK